MKKLLSIYLAIIMTIMIFPLAFASGTIIENDKNNTITDAFEIPSGTAVIADLGSSSDVDYYKVTPEKNGKLVFTFEHEFYDENKGWALTFYTGNSSGTFTELFSSNIKRNSSEKISFIPISVTANTTYCIKVERYYSSSYYTSAQYSVSYAFTPTEYYEKEFNDTFTKANLLTQSNYIEANLHTSGDTDYYYCSPEKNGKLQFIFKHNFYDSESGWDLTIYMRNEGGNYSEIESQKVYLKSSETVYTSVIGAKENTVYCIKIERHYSSSYYTSLQYSVSYAFTPTEYYEKEFNNSYGTANIIPSGVDFSGNLINNNDEDFYSFTANKTDSLKLDFKHDYYDSEKGWDIYLYEKNTDGTYSQLSKNGIYLKSIENVSIPFNASSGTSYCVKIIRHYSSSYYTGQKYTLNCDYGGATVINYTLTYNANGGSGAPASQTGSGSITLSSTKPSRSGYTFLGWSTSSSASSAQYQPGSAFNLTSDTTLYAVWKSDLPTPAVYTLYYNANGGSGTPASQTGSGSITLSNTKPTRSGYTFLGWSTSSSASSAQYQPGTAFNLTADTTLYAVWKNDQPLPKVYTLYYNANGGSGAPASQAGIGTVTISNIKPSKSGCGFLWWNTKPDDTGIRVAPGSDLTLSSDLTLYAIWQIFTPPVQPKIQIMDYTPSRSESYKSTISFSAAVTDAPAGSTIHWFINGVDCGTGYDYTVEKATNDYTVQARLLDANGNVIAQSEIENVKIESESIVARILSFFRILLDIIFSIISLANRIA